MSSRFSLTFSLHESHTAPAQMSDFDVNAIRGLTSPLPASAPRPQTAPVARRAPWSLFVPEAYEPRYAYPLIVWILDPSDQEHELCRRMAQVSTRNYFGVSLRTPLASSRPQADNGAQDQTHAVSRPAPENAGDATASLFSTDNTDPICAFEQQVFETVQQMRSDYHIHSERVFLAGFETAGTLALELSLRRPEWFAGVAVLSGSLPATMCPLHRFRDLRGKRVLLGWSAQGSDGGASIGDTGRLLHAAGMRVCTRQYEASPAVTRGMLTDMNRWVMREIYEPTPVA